jgi:AcrR family transcriptional regulator
MPRAGLNPEAVVGIATDIVDEHGPDAVTLAAVAARAGVATPSLYKHVGSLAELRVLVAARAMKELTDRIAAAVIGRSGDDAIHALMQAYRSYVAAHPGRYRLIPAQPIGEPRLEPVAMRLLDIILAVLRGFDLTGSIAIHGARCVRSAAHGFAMLEAAGGFGLPEDLDTSYEHLTAMLVAGLRSLNHQ